MPAVIVLGCGRRVALEGGLVCGRGMGLEGMVRLSILYFPVIRSLTCALECPRPALLCYVIQ